MLSSDVTFAELGYTPYKTSHAGGENPTLGVSLGISDQ
jgi:hypothetical protein